MAAEPERLEEGKQLCQKTAVLEPHPIGQHINPGVSALRRRVRGIASGALIAAVPMAHPGNTPASTSAMILR